MRLLRTLLAVAIWPPAALAALASLAALAGGALPWLDLLTHFAPLYLAVGLVSLLLSLLLREVRPMLTVLGAVAAASSLWLMVPEFAQALSPAPSSADGAVRLKLIQFNLWGRNRDVERTARWIADQDADVVVLEEAEPAVVRAILRRHPYHVTRGMLGVTILTRQRPLPRAFPLDPPWDTWPGLARASFPAPGGPYAVIGLHYSWPDRVKQARQMRRVEGLARRFDRRRLIIAGDLNSTPWSHALRRHDRALGLERRTHALFSWPAARATQSQTPAPFPILPIDHVYAGEHWRTTSVERGPALGSDHYPVIVELVLSP